MCALRISLLGEQLLERDGVALSLPPSKKTRALLSYLVLSRRAVRRERLCALLWDVADDPRAALRWSLSKLRELVDEPDRQRLSAEREAVRLSLDDVRVDVFEARELSTEPLSDVPTEALERALALFRGELLEGLELPEFHAYYAFCLSEREAMQQLLAKILDQLLMRAEHDPARALAYARRLVELDPSSSSARTRFLALLNASGRSREAALESRKNGRLLALGDAAPPSAAPRESRVPPRDPSFVGRERELAQARDERVLLVSGEAGIGKSSLMAALAAGERARGRTVLEGVARELDLGLPYAPFREPFAALGLSLEDDAPTKPASDAEAQRATASLVQRLLAAAPADALLSLDNLHWFDRASAQLLAQLGRERSGPRLLLSARPGELLDNEPARRAVAGLRELGLRELTLSPLSRDESARLVGTVAPGLDIDAIHRQSGGNPLFALELARARRDLPGVALPATVARVVRERMDGVPGELADVLRWAAVLGPSFALDALRALLSLEPEPFIEALEQLERLGWLRFDADGTRAYFSHELTARAIYDGLSGRAGA